MCPAFPGRRAAAVCSCRLGRRRLHDGGAGRGHQAALGGSRGSGVLQPLARVSAQRLGGIVSHTLPHKTSHSIISGLSRSVSHSQPERSDPHSLCEIAAFSVQTNRKVLLQPSKHEAKLQVTLRQQSCSICLDFYSVNICPSLSS